MPVLIQMKGLLVTKEQRYSAILTLIITLIIITPLCGFLFQCGCDWPWAGLDTKCNFYKLHTEHKCPWCASMLTGILSTGTAILAGIGITASPSGLLTYRQTVTEVTLRTVFAVLVFILMAIFTAGLAASWQSYPLGIGSYLKS